MRNHYDPPPSIRWLRIVTPLAFMATATILAAAGTAQAQLSDEVGGLKIGKGRLHPDFQIDTRVITNPGRLASQDNTVDYRTTISPGMGLEWKTETFELEVTSQFSYRRYFGANTESTKDFTGFDGNASVHFETNPLARSHLYANFDITSDPQHDNATIGGGRIDRTSLNNTFGGTYAPGGGALRISLEHQLHFNRFVDDDTHAIPGSSLDALTNAGHVHADWFFLPETALTATANFANTMHLSGDAFVGTTQSPQPVNAAFATIGVDGRITRLLWADAAVGYTWVASAAHNTRHEPVGHLRGRLTWARRTHLELSVHRRRQPSPWYGTYGEWTAVAKWGLALRHDTSVMLQGSYAHRDFDTPLPSGLQNRADHVLSNTFAVEHSLRSWLDVSLQHTLQLHVSNAATDPGHNFDYLHNETYVRFHVRY